MPHSSSRVIVLDTPHLLPDPSDEPQRLKLQHALLAEVARVRPQGVGSTLIAVCDAMRQVARAAWATEHDLLVRDDGPVGRAVAAAADWVRDIVLDADVLAGDSASEVAMRAEVLGYADLHVRAFVAPALADARIVVREALAPGADRQDLLEALEALEASVARVGLLLHDGGPEMSSAA